ncbi:anti-sigma-I factor RsgI family protein [Anaeromicropila herbilytica]|uniref:Anti-sigma factor RsgI-like middle domain-containing protein n=1 Tax=Anaeromicropila herbilytica TaxID=2785025 RepID=A0A7R7EHQ2_9FIRM|nr:hypothetical protein [Anaeromicropila herbilytica]BCN28925.1 hypothetical protein bsdtb5_02200 [Anaeromicropila herbilytica]
MNQCKVEKSIQRAIHQAPTLDMEYLSKLPIVKMSEHDYITKQENSHKTKHLKQFSAAFTCCMIVLLCFSGWFVQNRTPDSVITLDVNPSIQIVVNKKERVLSVKALNKDAKKVIDKVRLKTSNLDHVVDQLVTTMVSEHYIRRDKNVVMVSIENRNTKKADIIALSLDQVIQKNLSKKKITPQVIRQVFTKDKNASTLARKHNVSVGKLKLIQEILPYNETFTIDTLASKSVTELLALSKENSVVFHKSIQVDEDDLNAVEDTPLTDKKEKTDSTKEKTKEEKNLQSDKDKNKKNDNTQSDKKGNAERNTTKNSNENKKDNGATKPEKSKKQNNTTEPIKSKNKGETSTTKPEKSKSREETSTANAEKAKSKGETGTANSEKAKSKEETSTTNSEGVKSKGDTSATKEEDSNDGVNEEVNSGKVDSDTNANQSKDDLNKNSSVETGQDKGKSKP